MLGFRLSSAKQYAVLPLRDIVVFPHMIVPLFVGREKSVKALEKVMESGRQILLLTQKSPSIDDPTGDDLYRIGTIGTILQLLKLPDGTVKVLVEGEKRAHVEKYLPGEEYLEVEAIEAEDKSVFQTQETATGRKSGTTRCH